MADTQTRTVYEVRRRGAAVSSHVGQDAKQAHRWALLLSWQFMETVLLTENGRPAAYYMDGERHDLPRLPNLG